MQKIAPPIGISDFAAIRKEEYYYVDEKTWCFYRDQCDGATRGAKRAAYAVLPLKKIFVYL